MYLYNLFQYMVTGLNVLTQPQPTARPVDCPGRLLQNNARSGWWAVVGMAGKSTGKLLKQDDLSIWLVVWNMNYFPIYWE